MRRKVNLRRARWCAAKPIPQSRSRRVIDASSPANFAVKFSSTDGRCAVVIDDDGRVGYAYLLDADGRICGDVWLYNRCPAPKEPEWSDREKAPFANSEAYVDSGREFRLPDTAEDISIEWLQQGAVCEARVFIYQRLAAKLVSGAKPGWSAQAQKDGPLARVLLS
jgi:hypothetical protein